MALSPQAYNTPYPYFDLYLPALSRISKPGFGLQCSALAQGETLQRSVGTSAVTRGNGEALYSEADAEKVEKCLNCKSRAGGLSV